jgi:hypothetical protein
VKLVLLAHKGPPVLLALPAQRASKAPVVLLVLLAQEGKEAKEGKEANKAHKVPPVLAAHKAHQEISRQKVKVRVGFVANSHFLSEYLELYQRKKVTLLV